MQAFQGVTYNQNGQMFTQGGGPQAQVRAINVPQAPPVGLLFSPLMQMLSNNLKPPMLEKDHFMDFKLKFPTFLVQASAGQTGLTDDMKLGVLKICIPEGAQVELQRREEEHTRGHAPPPKFNDFWNWLCRTYGSGKDEQTVLKEELRTLKPENAGKLTLESWNAYMAQFKLLQYRLEDPNERELIEWVQSKVPHNIRNRLIGREVSQSESRPLLKVTGVDGVPLPVLDEALIDMLETVKFRTTFTLEPCRGGYLIKCSDNRAEDIFLRYGGLLMKSGHRPQFSFMEQKMSLQEVFSFVTQHLQANERSDQVCRMHGDWEVKPWSKKEKVQEPMYAVRTVTATPPVTPVPGPIVPPTTLNPSASSGSIPTPVAPAWNSGKGSKGKGDSSLGYTVEGYNTGKGFSANSGSGQVGAGRGPPSTSVRPTYPPQPCWLCGGTEYHWRDECNMLKNCTWCGSRGHLSKDCTFEGPSEEFRARYPDGTPGRAVSNTQQHQNVVVPNSFSAGKGKGQEKGATNQGKGASPPPMVGKGAVKGGKGGN